MIHQRTNSKAACKQQVKKSNDEDTPISPNSPHDVGHIQKKLMQILKPAIQQGKIYSPKNHEPKQFKSGYCMSVGNLVVQSQKTLYKSTTSSKSNLHQNLTAEDNKMRKIKSPKQPQPKVLVPRISIQKQNLFGLIKSINNFMSQSRQKQTDDLQIINDYLKKDNLVRSYDTREVSERASVVQFFKKIAHPESCTQLQTSPTCDFSQNKQVKKSVDDKVLKKNKQIKKNLLIKDPRKKDSRYRTLSSSFSGPQLKLIKEDKLKIIYNRMSQVLDVHKHREHRWRSEKDYLLKQVKYWKQQYTVKAREVDKLMMK